MSGNGEGRKRDWYFPIVICVGLGAALCGYLLFGTSSEPTPSVSQEEVSAARYDAAVADVLPADVGLSDVVLLGAVPDTSEDAPFGGELRPCATDRPVRNLCVAWDTQSEKTSPSGRVVLTFLVFAPARTGEIEEVAEVQRIANAVGYAWAADSRGFDGAECLMNARVELYENREDPLAKAWSHFFVCEMSRPLRAPGGLPLPSLQSELESGAEVEEIEDEAPVVPENEGD